MVRRRAVDDAPTRRGRWPSSPGSPRWPPFLPRQGPAGRIDQGCSNARLIRSDSVVHPALAGRREPAAVRPVPGRDRHELAPHLLRALVHIRGDRGRGRLSDLNEQRRGALNAFDNAFDNACPPAATRSTTTSYTVKLTGPIQRV